jgi:hypothetical protein
MGPDGLKTLFGIVSSHEMALGLSPGFWPWKKDVMIIALKGLKSAVPGA